MGLNAGTGKSSVNLQIRIYIYMYSLVQPFENHNKLERLDLKFKMMNCLSGVIERKKPHTK